ncbi:hypothetical protein C1141_21300, partial [Vibrio agarivorans]
MKKIAALILPLLLFACTTLPQTPDQTVYATLGAYTATLNTVADARDSGLITREQAQELYGRVQAYRPALDKAVVLVRERVGNGLTLADQHHGFIESG